MSDKNYVFMNNRGLFAYFGEKIKSGEDSCLSFTSDINEAEIFTGKKPWNFHFLKKVKGIEQLKECLCFPVIVRKTVTINIEEKIESEESDNVKMMNGIIQKLPDYQNSDWFKSSEELPEDNCNYLVNVKVNNIFGVTIGRYNIDNEEWFLADYAMNVDKESVTHWKLIPDAPKN